MVVTKENREVLGEKPVPTLFCPPSTSHGQCWDRTRASPVTGRRQTAWIKAQPTDVHFPKLPRNSELLTRTNTLHMHYKTNQFIVCWGIVAVSSENHTKHGKHNV
jgi:hypothetical protein